MGIVLLCIVGSPIVAGILGADRTTVGNIAGFGILAYVIVSIVSAGLIAVDSRKSASGLAWVLFALIFCIAAVPMYLVWTSRQKPEREHTGRAF